MHGMIGMTELLLHTSLSEQQRRFAEAAHNSGESLLNLINAILDFSKIEAAKVELETIDFCPVELIDEICYLQGEPSYRKGISIINICDESLPSRLQGDPTKIRQVVMNLVSNSIKFTHEGSIIVTAWSKAYQGDTEKTVLSITVEDTGIGMDSETQSRVFEAFTQADTSTTRQYGGTGLGLAISKQYVEMMNGNISVSSQPGKGTKIIVQIPLPISREPNIARRRLQGANAVLVCDDAGTIAMVSSHLHRLGASTHTTSNIAELGAPSGPNGFKILDYDFLIKHPDSQKSITDISEDRMIVLSPLTVKLKLPLLDRWKIITKPVSLSSIYEATAKFLPESTKPRTQESGETPELGGSPRKLILVAEDVEINQKIATEMLQLLDFDVDIAENGAVAFQKFKAGSYALVFMDCQMPILDGFEATQQIREFERVNNLPSIPIIALTAGISVEDKDRCLEYGMDDYLTKPFSISELRDSILKLEKKLQSRVKDNQFLDRFSNTSTPENSPKSNRKSEIFNMRAINNIREVEQQTGRALLPSILEGFTTQMREKLAEITINFRDRDSEKIYRTAHAIKSMSANIGAEKVREISADIEAKGRSGNIANVDTSFEMLHSAYSEFIEEFETRFIN